MLIKINVLLLRQTRNQQRANEANICPFLLPYVLSLPWQIGVSREAS